MREIEGFTGTANCEWDTYKTNIVSSICSSNRTSNQTNITAINTAVVKGYETALETAKAELGALVTEHDNLSTSTGTIDATLAADKNELEARAASLQKEIAELRRKADAASAAFEDNADPLEGGTGSSFKTLQEIVTLIVFITYAFAVIAAIAYYGYKSGWAMKNLVLSSIAAALISMALYAILRAFA